jgi:hypothetical protein
MLRAFIASLVGVALLSAAGAAQSTVSIYTTQMSGANEVPPNSSTATGFTQVTVDDVANSLAVNLNFTGLTGGPAAAAHIHCCTPVGTNVGVAVAFTGFPAATSGTYSQTFNLLDPTIYTPTFLSTFGGGTAAGAETALLAGLAGGMAYSNIHNAVFPGGEIQGFLAASIPEPATWALMIAGFGLLGTALRRRRPLRA